MNKLTVVALPLTLALSITVLGQGRAAQLKGIQKATIVVNNGFKPSTVSFKAGRPVQLTFDTKRRGCATSVIFQGLKLETRLTDGKKTVVTFTPKRAGIHSFACQMKMMTGRIIVK